MLFLSRMQVVSHTFFSRLYVIMDIFQPLLKREIIFRQMVHGFHKVIRALIGIIILSHRKAYYHALTRQQTGMGDMIRIITHI